jgi:hypothetical protein
MMMMTQQVAMTTEEAVCLVPQSSGSKGKMTITTNKTSTMMMTALATGRAVNQPMQELSRQRAAGK